MGLHRPRRDEEGLADGSVGQAVGHQLDDPQLGRCEAVPPDRRSAVAPLDRVRWATRSSVDSSWPCDHERSKTSSPSPAAERVEIGWAEDGGEGGAGRAGAGQHGLGSAEDPHRLLMGALERGDRRQQHGGIGEELRVRAAGGRPRERRGRAAGAGSSRPGGSRWWRPARRSRRT